MVHFHMFSSGLFLPGCRQDGVKGLLGVSVVSLFPGGQQALATLESNAASLFIAASPECARYSADAYNGHIAVIGMYKSGSIIDPPSISSTFLTRNSCHTSSFQLESNNARKIFARS
jgi:hypothetical protein